MQQRSIGNKAIWYVKFKTKNIKYIYTMTTSWHKGSKTGGNAGGEQKQWEAG